MASGLASETSFEVGRKDAGKFVRWGNRSQVGKEKKFQDVLSLGVMLRSKMSENQKLSLALHGNFS